ncbi:hypothetical protein E8E14_011768 [Neopestalotiopsis sp. 37M]|nr:hypothetical protein E8E14_011768 [Neopestalotiopsis sp. 37M]
MRGGLEEIVSKNAYFKPLVAFFIAIDVIAATTAPSTHPNMYAATLMALQYHKVEDGIFQCNLAISMPCPEELFQTLILVNYLRAIIRRTNLTSNRHAGTRMVLEKLDSFSAPQWALKMKYFRGWKETGDGVQFDDKVAVGVGAASPTTTRSSSTSSQDTTPGPSRASPRPKRESPDTPEPRTSITDLWLNVAIAYRSAILLYAVRTLITDVPEDKEYLHVTDGGISPDTLAARCLESRRALAECLIPIFADPTSAHDFGKLVYFPMFVCGMELEADDHGAQDWVTHGLETVGTACGTLGPISAAEELRGYWAASAECKRGERVTWDGWFERRPDFIFGF